MAGLFSKGGGTPQTPAQQQLQQTALQSSQNFSKNLLPVQNYFAGQVHQNAPLLQQQGDNVAASTARNRGVFGTQNAMNAASNRRASAGSGAFLLAGQNGRNATANATGLGLANANAAGQQRYVKGLQDIFKIGQQDQGTATAGLNSAASAQAQEAGANQAATQGTQQAVGQVAGLAAAFL